MASASKAQIRANRENAKRSTGPKTIQGKAVVNQNAVTHGVYVQSFMNEMEEEHYQLFLSELEQSYPSSNPLIKSQLVRLARVKTMLDRIQRTISTTYELPESTIRTNESIMDLLEMDQNQRNIANQIVSGNININGIINVMRIRVATELLHIDTSSFKSHDDYLYHTPILCKYLFDQATEANVSVDKFITHTSETSISSHEILERISMMVLKAEGAKTQSKKEIDIYAPYPPPSSIESEIKKTSLPNLHTAAELFKEEHNKLADLHHKVIAFNKLRKFEASPIPLNFDHLEKLFKIQGSLQNQYSKILGELIAITSNSHSLKTQTNHA